MKDNGQLTRWTAFLILAGLVLAFAGGVIAPDHAVWTWLLVAAWAVTFTALSNIYNTVRTSVRERQIREEERRRLI